MKANNSRRKFISSVTALAGGQLLITKPIASLASFTAPFNENTTVGQIMDQFISEVPGKVLKETVDTLKSGTKDLVVKGIVTSMFATVEVIKKSINLGANFIIAHEPTFYNHQDATAWLENDPVYQYKMDLLKKNNIAVWRNHDYVHRLNPDPVTSTFLQKLDWLKYTTKAVPKMATLPTTKLNEVITNMKTTLGVEQVRFIGDLNQDCSKLLFMLGASGASSHILGLRQLKPDVLICGEISEWETAEYIRDARSKGDNVSLIVLGHIASEEAGSEFVATWLHEKYPSIKTTHVPSGNSLSFF
jgi:putative NIF3 family GTP cyclohydrolase 1 type 2